MDRWYNYSNSTPSRGKGKGNIWLVEEKKNAKGKGGKYLEKENIWSVDEKRMENEKGHIWNIYED